MATKNGKIADEIQGIIDSRNGIRTHAVTDLSMTGVTATSKLADIKTAFDAVSKITATTQGLNAGGSVTIPANSYTPTAITISANALSGQTSGTATAAQILKDKTAWVNGTQLTGTMPNNTIGTYATSMGKDTTGVYAYFPAGYWPDNGKGGGSYIRLTKSDDTVNLVGDAAQADVRSGKTFTSKNGVKLSGSMPDAKVTSANYTITGSNITVTYDKVTAEDGTVTDNNRFLARIKTSVVDTDGIPYGAPALTCNTAGYISGTVGEKIQSKIKLNWAMTKINCGAGIYPVTRTLNDDGTTYTNTISTSPRTSSNAVTPVISRTVKPADDTGTWIDANGGAATKTKPSAKPAIRVETAAIERWYAAKGYPTNSGYGTKTAGQYSQTAGSVINLGAATSGVYYVPVKTGTAKGTIVDHSVTTAPVVTPSIAGTVTNITTTTAPASTLTEGTDYWILDPSGSVTTTGKSTANGKSEVTTAGWINADSAKGTNSVIDITPTVAAGTNRYISKASISNTTGVTASGTATGFTASSTATSYYVTAGATAKGKVSIGAGYVASATDQNAAGTDSKIVYIPAGSVTAAGGGLTANVDAAPSGTTTYYVNRAAVTQTTTAGYVTSGTGLDAAKFYILPSTTGTAAATAASNPPAATATLTPGQDIVISKGYYGSDRRIRSAKATSSDVTAASGFNIDMTDKTAAVTIGTKSGSSYPVSVASLEATVWATTPGWFASATKATGTKITDSTATVGTIAEATNSGVVSTHTASGPTIHSTVTGSTGLDITTTKPTGTEGTNYWKITSAWTQDTSGSSTAKAKGKITAAGYLPKDALSAESSASTQSISAAQNGTNANQVQYIKKAEITATPSVTTNATAGISGTGFTASSSATTVYVDLTTVAGTAKSTYTVNNAGYAPANMTANASTSVPVTVTDNRTRIYIPTKAAATVTPGTSDKTITSGVFLTGNQTIKAVSLSGATAANILTGTTVAIKSKDSSNADVTITSVAGTMPNNGAVTQTLQAGGQYTIPAGYHNGSGKITAATLASQTAATATAAEIVTGKTAWVNGSLITGSLLLQNYYIGSDSVEDLDPSFGGEGDIYIKV